MKVMLRQKGERGSMCIVYLFQLRLKFTSDLGNKDNSLSDKQSCINPYRMPLVTFETAYLQKIYCLL